MHHHLAHAIVPAPDGDVLSRERNDLAAHPDFSIVVGRDASQSTLARFCLANRKGEPTRPLTLPPLALYSTRFIQVLND
jgi:hypothetical protein